MKDHKIIWTMRTRMSYSHVDIGEARKEVEKWRGMTDLQFTLMQNELHAANLHAPHSREDELDRAERRLAELVKWEKDANAILNLWDRYGDDA